MSQFEYSVPIAAARTKEDMVRIANEWKAMTEKERAKVRRQEDPNPTRIGSNCKS